MLVGIISDTHGLLRPEAITALQGSELILHAGDVGRPVILELLGEIAPVTAVRGNIDTGELASQLPPTVAIEAGPAHIYMLHNLNQLSIDPAAEGFHLVISGHSHKPGRWQRDGVIYLNPGSAGPRRFQLPVSVARIDLGQTPWTIEIVHLTPAAL